MFFRVVLVFVWCFYFTVMSSYGVFLFTAPEKRIPAQPSLQTTALPSNPFLANLIPPKWVKTSGTSLGRLSPSYFSVFKPRHPKGCFLVGFM